MSNHKFNQKIFPTLSRKQVLSLHCHLIVWHHLFASVLNYFSSMFYFNTHWKRKETFGFLIVLGVMQMYDWAKMTLVWVHSTHRSCSKYRDAHLGNWQASMMDIFANTLNTLSVNPTKWSNRLKQFIGELPKNCLSLFDHFVGLALKELTIFSKKSPL